MVDKEKNVSNLNKNLTRSKDLIGPHRLCQQDLKDILVPEFSIITTFLEIFG